MLRCATRWVVSDRREELDERGVKCEDILRACDTGRAGWAAAPAVSRAVARGRAALAEEAAASRTSSKTSRAPPVRELTLRE